MHDVGRTLELARGPSFTPTDEGRLLGHVHLGLRLIEERAEGLTAAQRAELLHCVAVHHDARAARTAEASVLYHANQLDAIAATRPGRVLPAVFLALGASPAWGVADFFGPLAGADVRERCACCCGRRSRARRDRDRRRVGSAPA